MPFYERGDVRIHYEEVGSGFPLLVTPGGGLNSWMGNWKTAPFNAVEEFKNDFRVITMDQRNAPSGESTGPIPTGDGWDAFAEDQLGLMDHLGVREFAFLGCCIGGSFVMKMIEKVPDRIMAGVLCQPIGHRPENPDVMYDTGHNSWGPTLIAKRPELNMDMVDAYLHSLYRARPELVYSVSRQFIENCQTPVLVMPDDTPAHSYDVAIEMARILPKGEQTVYPWKEPKDLIPAAVERVRSFLKAHQPVLVGR